jgi:hypothetical protein
MLLSGCANKAMKYWGKLKSGDKISRDIIVETPDFKEAVNAVCDKFDLSRPLILVKHINDISNFRITVFLPDDFVESIRFDALEIERIVTRKKT